MRRSLFYLTVSLVVSACASASRSGQSRCSLTARDSVYLAGGPVYRECAVERRATPIDQSARPELDYTKMPPGGNACYSVELEFVVDTAGVPEEGTTTVLRTTNPDFASAVVAVVPRWRYRPATIDGVRVRQIVQDKKIISEVVVAAPLGQSPRPPPVMPTC